ncbi:MAG: PilX N-terminal domain-containing pilus assembly protein [Gammaproteobacteria bacterium]
MARTHNLATSSSRQGGVALIVALIMLMVLTMIAVIAMRTTTIDLKITTNQIIAKRAFQVSESARSRVHDVLDDHNFYRGWPVAIGGTIPASTGFAIPAGMTINGLPDLLAVPGIGDIHNLNPAFIDMRLRVDPENDGQYMSNYDMAGDIFVTFVGVGGSVGSDTGVGTGNTVGGGVGGAGAHRYYRIVSVAGGGTATIAGTTTRAVTDAIYRYVVTN